MFKNPVKSNKAHWKKQKSMAIGEVVRPMLAEMEERISWLQSMQKLDMKDGDIVVLRHPLVLSKEAIKNICTTVKEIIKESGFNVKVMFLEEGLDIGVLRKEKQSPS
jgi:hypothetical protein